MMYTVGMTAGILPQLLGRTHSGVYQFHYLYGFSHVGDHSIKDCSRVAVDNLTNWGKAGKVISHIDGIDFQA